jgi:hypothetical protein
VHALLRRRQVLMLRQLLNQCALICWQSLRKDMEVRLSGGSTCSNTRCQVADFLGVNRVRAVARGLPTPDPGNR